MWIIYIIISVVLILLGISKVILNFVFGKRCDGNPNLKYFTVDDFEELNSKSIEFKSDKGQKLRGNIYTNKNVNEYKGLIVFVHGMGGGHLSYTTEINTFTKSGFIVIGYDNTGTCSSEGKKLKGFFQSVIDLKYLLDFIKDIEELNKYKISLVGHSWGAYTACQVLQFKPNVKSVVSMSGCSSSENLICGMMGAFGKVLKPFITFINFLTFGKKGITNAKKVLKETSVPVLILHGNKDITCSIENSLVDVEYFKDKENIKTILYENKYHNIYQTRESEQYLNEVFGKIEEYKKKYKGKELEEKSKEIYKNIDYKKMTEEDNEVMKTIIEFINSNL